MPEHIWFALGLCICIAVAGCYAQESVEDSETFDEGVNVHHGECHDGTTAVELLKRRLTYAAMSEYS